MDEQFRRQPDPSVKENRAARSKRWINWLGGTYTFPYPSGHDCQAKVTMIFNWLEPQKSMRWTVDTLTADAAYPGQHRGSIIHQNNKPSRLELEWETPILSPYVRVQKKEKRADPVVGSSICGVSDWSDRTTVICDKKKVEVMVLQKVMEAVCNLLVHGPKTEGIPQDCKSPVKLGFEYSSNNDDIRDLIYSFFGKEARLRKAASFFSRAYNAVDGAKDKREVTSAERQSTIESVICLFEHFGILQEPPWVEEDDWAENLSKDLEGVRTYEAWQKMELKWATLASYSCGMELHRGPWAGHDWERRAI